jgi:hypothetical protein
LDNAFGVATHPLDNAFGVAHTEARRRRDLILIESEERPVLHPLPISPLLFSRSNKKIRRRVGGQCGEAAHRTAVQSRAIGVRRTRERVRIGRAMRRLPDIERRFVGMNLSYSQVRELTRVATPET